MRKIFFTTFFLFILVKINLAQCKFEKDEIDPFNKTRSVITKEKSINNNIFVPVSVAFGYVDSVLYLYVTIEGKSDNVPPMGSESVLKLLMSNDSVVELSAINYTTKNYSQGENYFRRLKLTYVISTEQLNLLSKDYITLYRFIYGLTGSTKKYEDEADKSKAAKIMEIANCLREII